MEKVEFTGASKMAQMAHALCIPHVPGIPHAMKLCTDIKQAHASKHRHAGVRDQFKSLNAAESLICLC